MIRSRIKILPVIGPIAVKCALIYQDIRGSIHTYFFFRKNRSILLRNKTLRGNWENRRCFILATGPSIKIQDLSKLSSELCISVSNFFVHPDFAKIKPEYHLFASSHDPITDAQMVAWLKDAEAHFPIGQKIFLADSDKYLVDKHKIFTNQNVYYYHLNTKKNINILRNISFTEQLPKINTIAHTAMYLAMYLGSKEINLLGVDHDWLLHIGESRHFYQETQSELVKRGYIEEIAKPETDLEKDFLLSVLLWKQYKKIKAYAEHREIRIFNSTPGSLLDVFPRKSLEKVLSEK